MSHTLERIQHQDRELTRFVEYQYSIDAKRELTDELTEASEKLSVAMRNPFEFEMRSDGELYFQDGSVGDVLRKSVLVAEEIVKTNPQFMTELIRRRIELQEYDDQRKLALGGEGDPDVLVVLSPIPDAVLAGVDLGAYDIGRRKTLVRVYERTGAGIRSTSMSLDRTDRRGLQAIAREFGQAIYENEGSEDILMKRFWGHSASLRDPVTAVRRLYDEQLAHQYGGEWYAGRQDDKVLDALEFIKSQEDIVEAHMARMAEIKNQPEGRRQALRKAARYDFAAALDRRKGGGSVLGDGGDLSGSGEAARGAGIEYTSDCPDGSSVQSVTVESAVNELFDKNKKERKQFISKTCPMCGDKNVLTKIEGSIISGSCGCARDICTNEEISVNRRQGLEGNEQRDHAGKAEEAVSVRDNEHTDASVKEAFGEHARIKRHIGIGAACVVAYDWRTGQVIRSLED